MIVTTTITTQYGDVQAFADSFPTIQLRAKDAITTPHGRFTMTVVVDDGLETFSFTAAEAHPQGAADGVQYALTPTTNSAALAWLDGFISQVLTGWAASLTLAQVATRHVARVWLATPNIDAATRVAQQLDSSDVSYWFSSAELTARTTTISADEFTGLVCAALQRAATAGRVQMTTELVVTPTVYPQTLTLHIDS